MDASTKILTLLSEAIVDALTPGQIAEATGLSLSTTNVHLAKLTQRKYVYFSGSIATSGRYAKQYSISPDGLALVASGHTDLIITNEDSVRVAEQMLEYFRSIMDEEATRLEKLLADLNAATDEIERHAKSLNSESVALARVSIPTAQPVAEKTPPVAKKELPVWQLASYEDGEDITPLVKLLKSKTTYRKWLSLRTKEYDVAEIDDLPKSLIPVINSIARAAMAEYGWSLTDE